jgi:uncharacterized protein with GYD domain
MPRQWGFSGRGNNHADIRWNAELDGPGSPYRQGYAQSIQAARERAKKFGIEIKHVFLTTGEFDILVIADAKDGDGMAKMAMMAGAEGNVRTRTIRAWTEPEIAKLISELP